MRAMGRCELQGPQIARGLRQHPDFPMRAEAVLIAVPSDRSVTAVVDDVDESLGENRIGVVGLRSQPPCARVRQEHRPWQPLALLLVAPDILLLPEEFLVER